MSEFTLDRLQRLLSDVWQVSYKLREKAKEEGNQEAYEFYYDMNMRANSMEHDSNVFEDKLKGDEPNEGD